MKLGMKKATIHDRAADEQVQHKHVPGKAYEIGDPVAKLIHMVGGGFFNEPKYYDTKRDYNVFMAELLSTGRISSTIIDDKGLTEQAREVLETGTAVANGRTPEDLLVIATWARDTEAGLKLRTTPQILLVLAAAHEATKPFVPKYATSIMKRADDIRQVFGAFRHLFMAISAERKEAVTRESKQPRAHYGALPHCLRKALALALTKQSEYALLKYNGSDRPTFGDVLKMIGGTRLRKFLEKQTGETRSNWPVSKAMFEFLVNGKYVEPLSPLLAARKAFFESKDATQLTSAMVKDAGLTWENVISHLGSNKQTWQLCIPLMNEMALTRNLRNFEDAAIDSDAWDKVYEKMNLVEDTVQLPFRFFAAIREVKSTAAKSLLGTQLDKAVEKVTDLPGVTLVMVDNSGSAQGCALSQHSSLVVSDAGNMLAAILAKKLGRRAIVGVFGDSLIWAQPNQADSCLTIKERIDQLAKSGLPDLRTKEFLVSNAGVGQRTETGLWLGLHDLTERKVHVDRFILLSDLCCYTQGDNNCGVDMTKYVGPNATIQSLVDKYRQTVNKDCHVYSVNLNGHGQAQTRPNDKHTYLLSGWSEKLVDMIRGLESPPQQQGTQAAEMPVIEQLRIRYRR